MTTSPKPTPNSLIHPVTFNVPVTVLLTGNEMELFEAGELRIRMLSRPNVSLTLCDEATITRSGQAELISVTCQHEN